MSGYLAAMSWAVNRLKNAEIQKVNKAIRRQEKRDKELKNNHFAKKISASEKSLLKHTHNLSRIEENDASEILCPECQIEFYEIHIEGQVIDACNKCRGVWFDEDEFLAYTKAPKDLINSGLYHRKSKFDCPRCSENMRECVYKAHSNLLIDSCENGCGLFFEQGEVRRAIKLNQED